MHPKEFHLDWPRRIIYSCTLLCAVSFVGYVLAKPQLSATEATARMTGSSELTDKRTRKSAAGLMLDTNLWKSVDSSLGWIDEAESYLPVKDLGGY